MGGNGSGPQLTEIQEIGRTRHALAQLYPHAIRLISRALNSGEPSAELPFALQLEQSWRVVEHRDGKPTQRQANADGTNLPAPVIAIQIVAPPGYVLPTAQVKELGSVEVIPQSQTSPLKRSEAAITPTESPAEAQAEAVPNPSPSSPSESNLYGFEGCKNQPDKPQPKAKAKLKAALPNDYSANLEAEAVARARWARYHPNRPYPGDPG